MPGQDFINALVDKVKEQMNDDSPRQLELESKGEDALAELVKTRLGTRHASIFMYVFDGLVWVYNAIADRVFPKDIPPFFGENSLPQHIPSYRTMPLPPAPTWWQRNGARYRRRIILTIKWIAAIGAAIAFGYVLNNGFFCPIK